MAIIFSIIFFVCNLGLIVGFFKPEWALYKLNVKKTPITVLKIYGTLSVIMIFLFIFFERTGYEDDRLAYDFNDSEYEGTLKSIPENEFGVKDQKENIRRDEEQGGEKPDVSREEALSPETKREVIGKLRKIRDRAVQEAKELNPAGPGDFSNGDELILIKKTNVNLKTKDRERTIILPPGSWVKFLNINNERDSNRFTVEIFTPDGIDRGNGWITKEELQKQWGNREHELEIQKEMARELEGKYRKRILKEYDLTEEQLIELSSGM